MKINDKITFRTAGRGQIKTWKGTVFAIVKAGQLPAKKFWPMLNHANKKSNRDRLVVELTMGDFAWANASGPNTAGPGEKLKEYRRRGQGKRLTRVQKKIVKASKKGGLSKTKQPVFGTRKPKKLPSEKAAIEAQIRERNTVAPTVTVPVVEPVATAPVYDDHGMPAEPKALLPENGGTMLPMKPVRKDKPKKTWYGPNGEAVRKVVCPEGFSATKPIILNKEDSAALTEILEENGEPTLAFKEAAERYKDDKITPTPDLEPHDITADAVSLNTAG